MDLPNYFANFASLFGKSTRAWKPESAVIQASGEVPGPLLKKGLFIKHHLTHSQSCIFHQKRPRRHGQPRKPDRSLLGAHQAPHRTPEAEPQGLRHRPRAQSACRPAPQPSGLSDPQGHQPLPRDHRQEGTRYPQVIEITTELKTTGHLKDVRWFFLYTKRHKKASRPKPRCQFVELQALLIILQSACSCCFLS